MISRFVPFLLAALTTTAAAEFPNSGLMVAGSAARLHGKLAAAPQNAPLTVKKAIFPVGGLGTRLAVNRVEDFLAVDRDLLGGDNAQADLVPADLNHRHGDIVVDNDTFVFFPGQH